MLSSSLQASSHELGDKADVRVDQTFDAVSWPSLPELPKLTGSTVLDVGRRFFLYSPQIILKLGTDEGEAIMTKLAYEVLGSIVPRLHAFVSIMDRRPRGILISRQPGVPLSELWPSLSSKERAATRESLVALLVNMRTRRRHLSYYGRPGDRPYITLSDHGPNYPHSFCHTRSEWDESRIRAVHSRADDSEISDDRIHLLERIQKETAVGGAATLVYAPVLTHGDLSDRNILVDPTTHKVTALLDWELANVAPAYFEYASACLCGGHQPGWRKELLEILRQVLRIECEHELTQHNMTVISTPQTVEDLFTGTLAAWNRLVDVERSAQGYSDACYWTFEHGTQIVVSTPSPSL